MMYIFVMQTDCCLQDEGHSKGLYIKSDHFYYIFWVADPFTAMLKFIVGEWGGELREADWKHEWRVTSQRLL